MKHEKIIELDLSNVNRSITTLNSLIIQALKERSLYKEDLLYRGFDGSLVDCVLAFGSENQDDRFIYANPESYLDIDPDPRWINPLSYARAYGMLAVYGRDRLKEHCFTCYEFLDQARRFDALVAIFPLKDG